MEQSAYGMITKRTVIIRIQLPIIGTPLESGQKYWWRVTVWTNTGDKAQSSIQYWSMALLDSSDWKAGWIGLNDSTNLKLDGCRSIIYR